MEFTKDTFKAAFPDLFAEIQKEAFEKGVSEGVVKGKADGAEAERNRIKGVEDQLIPGHEVLIGELKYDGKTTGPEAAVLVLKKERELMRTKREDILEDGKKVKVKDAIPPDPEQKAKVDPDKELEAKVKEKMAGDPKLDYSTALILVQKENPELAKKILEKLDAQRNKDKE